MMGMALGIVQCIKKIGIIMSKEKELLIEISKFLPKQGNFKTFDIEERDKLLSKIEELV